MRQATKLLSILLFATLGIVVFAPSEAQAWRFNADCAGELTTATDFEPPHAMMMLDRSGSMHGGCSYDMFFDCKNWQEASGRDYCAWNDRVGFWFYVGNNEYHQGPDDTTWFTPITWGAAGWPIWGVDAYLTCGSYWCYGDYFDPNVSIPGSTMGAPFSGYYGRFYWHECPGSLMDGAKVSIWEVVQDLQYRDDGTGTYIGELEFGYGVWSTSYASYVDNGWVMAIGLPTSMWGMILVEAGAANTLDQILAWLIHPQLGGPRGGTPTADAIRKMYNSNSIQNAPSGAAGILITDGVPTEHSGGNDPRNESIRAACEHRGVAPMFSVGFGSGTDTDFNNVLAAAGGTGTCSEGDPCAVSASTAKGWSGCTGSYQADDTAAFKQALLDISTQISCTFPLDASGWGGSAPNAGEAVKVRGTDPSGNAIWVPYAPDNAGQGWTFATSARNSVYLSDPYCSYIKQNQMETVTTTVACPCTKPTGDACNNSNAPPGVCVAGTWICDEGTDKCDPTAWESCPDKCANVTTGEACNVSTDPELMLSRCNNGITKCDPATGNTYCESDAQPMPELCNGLDDDCDGSVDNITASWDKSEFGGYSLADDDEPKACMYRSVCRCWDRDDDGTIDRDNHSGPPYLDAAGNATTEFEDFVTEWDPACECGEGLSR